MITKQATTTTMTMMRVMVMLAVLMAAIVVLSGPVGAALDLPEPTAEAKKKKKKKKRPAFTTVQCASGLPICNGTAGNDYLIGSPQEVDDIRGGEGNDVYDGKGAPSGPPHEEYTDASSASSDSYLFPATDWALVTISDAGSALGSGDTLYLTGFDRDEVQIFRADGQSDGEKLFVNVDGPGRSIIIEDHFLSDSGPSFGSGKIEHFVFKDGTLTAEQLGL